VFELPNCCRSNVARDAARRGATRGWQTGGASAIPTRACNGRRPPSKYQYKTVTYKSVTYKAVKAHIRQSRLLQGASPDAARRGGTRGWQTGGACATPTRVCDGGKRGFMVLCRRVCTRPLLRVRACETSAHACQLYQSDDKSDDWRYRGTSLIRNRPHSPGPPKEPRHGPTLGSYGVAFLTSEVPLYQRYSNKSRHTFS